jgi:hypothetical protein
MKILGYAGCAAILLVASAASAQNSAGWGQGYASQNDYAAPTRRLHRSGNECAPDRAEAVWGPGNAFLGYSCEPPSANGN